MERNEAISELCQSIERNYRFARVEMAALSLAMTVWWLQFPYHYIFIVNLAGLALQGDDAGFGLAIIRISFPFPSKAFLVPVGIPGSKLYYLFAVQPMFYVPAIENEFAGVPLPHRH
jgi:hypothetical protein